MKKWILVIDDDVDILDALEFMLTDAGYRVTLSEKGEYAENLHKRKGDLPDLMILDVLLSGKDGRTICRTLKKNPQTRTIPVIMISAHPSAANVMNEVGADDFLAKPFNINTLLGKIEVLLQNGVKR